MFKISIKKILLNKTERFWLHVKNYLVFCCFIIYKRIIKFKKEGIKKNTILFFNNGQMGDLLVSSVIFENDELLNQSYKYYFLIKEEYSKIFKNYAGLINIITYDYDRYRKSIFYKAKLITNINKLGVKFFYNLCADRGVLTEEFSSFVDAEIKICLNKGTNSLDEYLQKYFNKYYTELLFDEDLNEYEKNVLLLKQYLLRHDTSTQLISINEKKILKESISKRPYIAIAPFTSNMHRNWGIERYEDLILKLSNKYNIILLGEKKDENKIEKNNKSKEIINLIGKTTLNEAENIIANCMLYIGNDSGLTHVAFKLDKPIIALIGGGRWNRFFPYYHNTNNKVFLSYEMKCFGCGWLCHYEEMYCLTKINVDKIVLEAKNLLGK